MTQFHLRYHLQSNKNVLEAGEGVDTYSIWPHKANLGMKAKEIRQLPRNFQVLATNLNESGIFFHFSSTRHITTQRAEVVLVGAVSWQQSAG